MLENLQIFAWDCNFAVVPLLIRFVEIRRMSIIGSSASILLIKSELPCKVLRDPGVIPQFDAAIASAHYSKPGSGQCTTWVATNFSRLFQV